MARALATANIRRSIAATTDQLAVDDESKPPPGHIRLHTFSKPPLDRGKYSIEATQQINSPDGQTLSVFNFDNSITLPAGQAPAVVSQNFTVVAPKFSLDPKVINSYYPPDGQVEEGRILPHIVFNDPHIPWDRSGAPGRSQRQTQVPWVALLVFDPEELTLTPEDGINLGIPAFNPTQLPSSGAYPMAVGDYLTKVTSRVNYPDVDTLNLHDEIIGATDPTSIIFPQTSLIAQLFPPKSLLSPVLFSHVREVSTIGFPDSAGDDTKRYAITVSQRSGPLGLTAQKSQIAHLISIENLLSTPLGSGPSDRIGIVSLFSFRYTSVPPDPTNFLAIMKLLADQMQMLMPPQQILTSIEKSATTQTKPELKTAAQFLSERLSLGYCISRWRTATGEETIAFVRGVLTPVLTPQRPSNGDDWPDSSNSGKEYQILDRNLGVMDITYSSAFQVGKLMAVSDPIFASAMFRFRSLVQNRAASNTRMTLNRLVPASAIINHAPTAIAQATNVRKRASQPARANLPSSASVAPSLRDPRILPQFRASVRVEVDAQAGAGQDIYTDYNLGKANNSDWEIIHKWINDKLFLLGIPFHYLITDPSQISGLPKAYKEGDPITLPPEALRFFYIDTAWLDCFIDGALSVANHLDPGDDFVRRAIKEVFNVFLRNTIDPALVKPPVPRYGFLVRSQVIKSIPELKVTIRCRKSSGPGTFVVDDSRAPLVRFTKIDDFTLLVLLDCFPEDIFDINFAQPPHQQRFAAPVPPIPDEPFPVKQVFTDGAPDGPWPTYPQTKFPDIGQWYDPTTRIINSSKMAQDLAVGLPFSSPPQDFTGTIDPATFALILNDENWQLTIQPPLLSAPGPNPPPDRQLWVNGPDTAPSPPPPTTPAPPITPVTPSQPPTTTPILVLPLNPSTPPLTSTPSPTPPTSTTPPSYTLRIHPSYRPAAPLPFTDTTTTQPRKVYSANDYIPTTPTHLPSLIFSIHPTPSAPLKDAQLVSLTIQIPLATTNPPTSPPGPEPLIQLPYTGGGASMLHNHHPTPTLTLSPSTLNPTTLNITLTPRLAPSAAAQAENPIFLPGPEWDDASFILRDVMIAPIVTTSLVEVLGEVGGVERGVVEVTLLENWVFAGVGTGQTGTGIAVGQAEVLKRGGGDVDLLGNEV